MLTHPRTNDKAKTIDLEIGGGLWIKKGGKMHANEMSDYRGPSGGSYGSAGYGGSPYRGSGSENVPYGSFRNPDDLGTYASYSNYYAGGRIVVQTAWLKLDGSTEAKGNYGGSGGTVNIKVGVGGVTGSGTIDVSVKSGSSYGGGGVRAAITGYSRINLAVIENVVMHGNEGRDAGAGTFFYEPDCKTVKDGKPCNGILAIRSPFEPNYDTYLNDDNVMLDSWELENAKVIITGNTTVTGSVVVPSSSNLVVQNLMAIGGSWYIAGSVSLQCNNYE